MPTHDIMDEAGVHESLEEEAARKGPDTTLPEILDVRKQLIFYGSYHSHPVNVAVHMVCIPILLWSAFLFAAHVPLAREFPYVVLPETITRVVPALKVEPYGVWRLGKWLAFQPNLGLVLNVLYTTYYIMLERFGGITYIPVAILSHLTTTSLATSPSHNSLKIATISQIIAWLAQFAGHGFAEKRAPALFDSLLGAVVLAPFFSHLEVLFLVFNWNPKLQAEIKAGVSADKARRAAVADRKARGVIAPRGNATLDSQGRTHLDVKEGKEGVTGQGTKPTEVNGARARAKRGGMVMQGEGEE